MHHFYFPVEIFNVIFVCRCNRFLKYFLATFISPCELTTSGSGRVVEQETERNWLKPKMSGFRQRLKPVLASG